MVERQLRRRGIEDERVLAAMAEVPRELFVPADQRRRAYRDGALRIGEGQTISQPWIVACMASCSSCAATERVLEVGTGSGYAAAVLSRLVRAGGDDRALREPRRRARPRRSPSWATTTSRCAWATARAARPTARRSAASRSPPPPQDEPPARAARPARAGRRAGLPGRARAARAADALPRRRARRSWRPCASCRCVERRRVIREFSAGGVVVRSMRGRPFVAVVRVRDEILALPKGHPDGDESPAEAAQREVREETGLEAELVERLGDVRYWYTRGGERVLKIGRPSSCSATAPAASRTTTTRSRRRSGSRSRRRPSGSPTRASARWPLRRCPGWREGR